MNILGAAAAAAATRRFLARSGREALRLVREALGEDAVIVTHRMTQAGVEIVAMPPEEGGAAASAPSAPATGKPLLRVVSSAPPVPAAPAPLAPALQGFAAQDAAAPAVAPRAAASQEVARRDAPMVQVTPRELPPPELSPARIPAPMAASVPAPAPATAFAAPPAASGLPPVAMQPAAIPRPVVPAAAHATAFTPPAYSGEAMLQELLSMRGLLEAQLAGRQPGAGQPSSPLHGHLLRLLLGAGFSGRLARGLLAQLPADLPHGQGLEWLQAALARQLPVLAHDDALLDAGGVYALVGPTGVGKTTTTAKLAARCVLRFGPERLALVTTDSFRIGACEQLRIYGRILGVPVHAVKDAGDLHLVLQDLRDKHMVLIDTVGMSQRDRAVAEQIAMLGDTPRPVHRLLVLNATSHGDTLDEVVHAYRGQGLAGCILTKTDEATHLGAVMDTVMRHGLAVHYVSSGQQVPEHLELAQPAALVQQLLRVRSRTALFVPGEIDVPAELAPLRNEADVARAQSMAQRLQAQCRQLVRALTSDAREVALHARALADAGIGFERVQALWRELAGADAVASAPLQLQVHCGRHVLAACEDETVLLLSDRDGQALGAVARTGLESTDCGRPLVLLMEEPPVEDPGLPWVARVAVRTRVWLVDGSLVKLSALALDLVFGAGRDCSWRGQAARQAYTETQVALEADGPLLRLLVERITEAHTGRLLAQRYVLAAPALTGDAAQLLQWQAWRDATQTGMRQLRDVQRRLATGGFAEAVPADGVRVAQALTTVWRLQQVEEDWGVATRQLLAQLAGHRVPAGRAVPAAVLFEGMGRLCLLLEAQASEDLALPAAPAIEDGH